MNNDPNYQEAVMLKQGIAATDTEAEFDERRRADRDRLKDFFANCGDGQEYTDANPGYGQAREYFRYYLDRRPSKTAAVVLAFAFGTWQHLKGVSDEVRRAVEQISEEPSVAKEMRQVWTEVWESVEAGIVGPFQRDDRFEEGLSLVEALAERLSDPMAEALLLRGAMRVRVYRDLGMQIARRNAERILELDTRECPEWIDPHQDARNCLYECDNLNIGQPAPHFAELMSTARWLTFRISVGGCGPQFLDNNVSVLPERVSVPQGSPPEVSEHRVRSRGINESRSDRTTRAS